MKFCEKYHKLSFFISTKTGEILPVKCNVLPNFRSVLVNTFCRSTLNELVLISKIPFIGIMESFSFPHK